MGENSLPLIHPTENEYTKNSKRMNAQRTHNAVDKWAIELRSHFLKGINGQ